MTTMTFEQKNGSKPHIPDYAPIAAWLKQPVRQFFGGINWDDNPPEVQELKVAASEAASQGISAEPLNLTFKVSQFFGAYNWDGLAIAAPTPAAEVAAEPTTGANNFTLEDFSDLF